MTEQELEMWQHDLAMIEMLRKENEKLEEKINKAIEYIENEGEHTDCSGEPIYYLDEEQEEELLEILKGE